MKDKSCLDVSREFNNQHIPDYHPTSLKQAKAQMKSHCLGITTTTALLGLHFRTDHLSESERDDFDAYINKICNNKLKQWNKAKKK